MMFISRATIATIVFFISISVGQLILEYYSEFIIGYLALCLGVLAAYLAKVYEG